MIESRLRGPRLCSPFSYGLWAWPRDILWPMRNFRYNASRWLKSACTLVLSSLVTFYTPLPSEEAQASLLSDETHMAQALLPCS